MTLDKTCIICANKKRLNNFYPRPNDGTILIKFKSFISAWLENYLEMKVGVLGGLAELDKTPREELTRDIELLTDILRLIKRRSRGSSESWYIRDLSSQERLLNDLSTYHASYFSIEQVDQLVSILANEYKHIKSNDDTYHHSNNKKILGMLEWILHALEWQARESTEDVCDDCLRLHHKVENHKDEYCRICTDWECFDKKAMFYVSPKDFKGWTDFQFSYEIPRVRKIDR